jgi:F0F1-type ATP synthase assembly protein I
MIRNMPTPAKHTDPPKKATPKQISSLLIAMADTTARMTGPSVVTVGIGLYSDLHFHTLPIFTLISTVLGLGISAILIRKSLTR